MLRLSSKAAEVPAEGNEFRPSGIVLRDNSDPDGLQEHRVIRAYFRGSIIFGFYIVSQRGAYEGVYLWYFCRTQGVTSLS
jgi:hypothetical protein